MTTKVIRYPWLMLLCLTSMAVVVKAQENSPCSFTGTPLQQAQCLLRPVAKYGHVDSHPATLPALLNRLIGQPTEQTVSKSALSRYLAAHQITEGEIGGPLSSSVSKTSEGRLAAYFIIHDTSNPVYGKNAPFPPADMDAQTGQGIISIAIFTRRTARHDGATLGPPAGL